MASVRNMRGAGGPVTAGGAGTDASQVDLVMDAHALPAWVRVLNHLAAGSVLFVAGSALFRAFAH